MSSLAFTIRFSFILSFIYLFFLITYFSTFKITPLYPPQYTTMFNPFSGWTENKGTNGSPPSIFGALPYPRTNSNQIKLTFTSYNPSILNCNIICSQGQIYYQVFTDPHNPGYTVIRNASGKNVALIEWQSRPLIEIRGILSKHLVADWLKLSQDRSSRNMDIRGFHYTWSPRNEDIELVGNGPSKPILLARITREATTIMLEVTLDAIQLGIVDSIVTAAFLLQCGRNID
ncbi:hypothetical protein AX15_000436 [Amanita polypyramis BW_CC]|nr:hypothetical protein AX15_000436 [Amanita polypyramis BW_CC]